LDEALITKMETYFRKGVRVPLLTLIRLSSKCNCRCFMCESWKKAKVRIKDEDLFCLIERVSALGGDEIRLTGGEPTMHPNLVLIAERIRISGLNLSIITNGSGNKKLMKKIVELGAKRIYVSIDSPSSDVHDSLRSKPGLFKSALQTIETINEANKNAIEPTNVTINTVVSKYNFDKIPQMAELCAKHNVREINPIPIKNIRNAYLTKRQIHKYNTEIVPELESILDKSDVKIRYGDPYIFGRSEKQISESSEGIYTRIFYTKVPCYVEEYCAFVDEFGCVYPCSNTPYMGTEFAFGNIGQQPFDKIWNGKYALCTQQRKPVSTLGKCISCDGTNVYANKKMYHWLIDAQFYA
jgi:MoaA/NifB/PqqE/SkfB family radical SAM enzyme